MIAEIAEAAGVGTAFLLGWMAKHIITNKKVVKEDITYNNVYPFEPLSNWHCPQCGLAWQNESCKFCECDEHFEGHFHMECLGTRGGKKDVGCGAKWLMLSKSKR